MEKSKSIKLRLVTMYIVLVIIIMTVSGTLIFWLTSTNEYTNLEDELMGAARVIVVNASIDSDASTTEIEQDLKDIIQEYGKTYTDKRVYLLDKSGTVIYPIKDGHSKDQFYFPQVMAALYEKELSKFDEVRFSGSDVVYRGYAEPIYSNGVVEYVVYVIASTEYIKSSQMQIIEIIMIAMILAVVLAGVLGVVFSNFITMPIRALSKKARDMAAGNLENTIEVLSRDEIGELTRNFNVMATSLNETLREISSEKNKLEIVFAHMTDGILVFNKEGLLIHSNPASINMLNITNEMKFEEVFSPYFENSFHEIVRRIKREIVQHIIKEEDKYYNACLAKFLDQNNNIMGVICVIQDITEHKKLEEMQKEFVANVSHELRTPLTTIKSYTETLIDGAMHDEEITARFLNVINHEGDRMTTLVQDLLDLSKLDNKQTIFKMSDINLNLLVKESVDKYKIHANKKNQQLTYHETNHNHKVFGDLNRVEQVIKNIVSNAVKYSQDEAKIDIYTYEEKKYIVVEVSDSGMGIPKEDIARIFERFYRVDKARSRDMGGTGLGLSIAKEIMECHGGKIEVDSTIGEGTTFYLYFPKKRAGK